MSDPVTSPAAYGLLRHPEPLAVAGLPVGADVPSWAESSSILSVTVTAAETSVVCAAQAVPAKVPHQGPFTAFAVEGPLDLALTGVLSALLEPLAGAEISVFTISTHATDWILVPAGRADDAEAEWRRRGHRVAAAPAHP